MGAKFPYSNFLKEIQFYFIRQIKFPYDQQPVKSSQHLPYAYVDISFNRWDIAAKVYELSYKLQRQQLLWPSALCLSHSPGLLNRRPGSPLCWVRAFSTASCDQRVSKHSDFLSSPSYITVQSPTQYLWNGMFDCHQAEITVMQFTGHSLLVHQSMTVAWDFTLSHIVSQARLRDFFP